uniref:Uncharacterized protein n=1 Tax=Anguilla anguilla TaxID=7936 RepID=A0A0E9SUX0_ANGAN
MVSAQVSLYVCVYSVIWNGLVGSLASPYVN